jgi:hypothetical protein
VDVSRAANRNEAKAIWNEKGCKKGMIAIEKNWADIGNGEPFTMAAIANIFRTESGEPPDKLDLKEVGEFLAGGAPHTLRWHALRAQRSSSPAFVCGALVRLRACSLHVRRRCGAALTHLGVRRRQAADGPMPQRIHRHVRLY